MTVHSSLVTHAIAQPCRHTTSEAFQALQGLCDIYIYILYDITFGMLQGRENDISLRKWSGGTAQLRTLEGTLVDGVGGIGFDAIIIEE